MELTTDVSPRQRAELTLAVIQILAPSWGEDRAAAYAELIACPPSVDWTTSGLILAAADYLLTAVLQDGDQLDLETLSQTLGSRRSAVTAARLAGFAPDDARGVWRASERRCAGMIEVTLPDLICWMNDDG